MNPSATFPVGRPNIGSEVESSTIERQRRELQLLIGELKDRDKELNDMVAVHQRQLLSWEEDRQKVLTLEERCSRLEGELHKRTDIIKSLTKKVKTLESNQAECQAALQKTQLQLQEMAQKAAHSSLLSEDLEARNDNLSNTLVELSAQVGQLQAREQALTTMIKLKDKDIIEAVNHISECSGKFKLLEHALRDAKMVETCIAKEKQDYKQKLKVLKVEVGKLKDDLTEKTAENNEQREEIIRLKQEKSCLQDELVFAAEREKRKDELLDIAKSKQERTNAELRSLRQVYVKQQSDLQFLSFSVDSSQELIGTEGPKALELSRDLRLSDLSTAHPRAGVRRDRQQKPLAKDQTFASLLAQQAASDKSPCDVCREKRQLSSTLGGTCAAAGPTLPAEGLVEKRGPCCPGRALHMEPEDKSALCAVHARSLPREERQPWAPPPGGQHWHDVSVYLGLADCAAAKQPAKLDAASEGPGEGCGAPCVGGHEARETRCRHPRDVAGEAPGHMSDVEWMSIFKTPALPRLRHQAACTCSGSAAAASEQPATQHARGDEKPGETECACDQNRSPKPLASQDAALPGGKDDFSPTSKLQRLLAESRQMVTDLELSTLLPVGAQKNVDVSGESAPKSPCLCD